MEQCIVFMYRACCYQTFACPQLSLHRLGLRKVWLAAGRSPPLVSCHEAAQHP